MRSAYLWYGRLIGTAVLLYAGFLLLVSLAETIAGTRYDSALVAAWVLASAVAGIVGSLLFLASIDGPQPARKRTYRMIGWWLMFGATILPTSVSFVLLPLVLGAIGLTFPIRFNRT